MIYSFKDIQNDLAARAKSVDYDKLLEDITTKYHEDAVSGANSSDYVVDDNNTVDDKIVKRLLSNLGFKIEILKCYGKIRFVTHFK